MSSFGDDLSRGGLGSSSSFTVALIKAIFMMNGVDLKKNRSCKYILRNLCYIMEIWMIVRVYSQSY